MATSLKRIEKEFILKAVMDEKIRLLLIAGAGEWPVVVTRIDDEEMSLTHTMPLRLLRRSEHYEFRFVYREQPMAFRSRVLDVKETSIVVEMPQVVYKNLGRRYSRRRPPAQMAVSFSFKGDRYDLAFPVTKEFDPVSEPEPSAHFDPNDIRGLVRDFDTRAQEYASERAVRMFKDRLPESIEEKLIVRTGKIYYLPTAIGGLPVVDPYVRPRIVTKEIFADFLREQGVREDLVDDEIIRFERNKRNSGTLSELMVPLIFQEYVIGYVCLINKQVGKPPFDLALLESFHQFAKVLVYSLKINGYFRNAPKKASDFPAEVIDISAGGLLFTNASKELAASLLPGSSIEINIRASGRNVRAGGSVKRAYRDAALVYYGIEYEEIAPEDFRFLFEALYGRDFTDADATGIEGLGIRMPLKLD
ncbi:MAG TPA: PilZ domain-containing protein [Rectinemataceae bacterium]|nr:PilZ domain-containing protein [Rectinemataceae bacterium]